MNSASGHDEKPTREERSAGNSGSTAATELFYDDTITLGEKRLRLMEMANADDTVARGYLESVNRIERSMLRSGDSNAVDEARAIVVTRLVEQLGKLIPERCRERGLVRINERDQLQPWSVELLRRVAEVVPEMSVSTAVPMDYKEHWPRVGDVDIALDVVNVAPLFLELKCGESPDALGPCAWDVLKLALALRRGGCDSAYLLAATTEECWRQPVRGAEFFSSTRWDCEEIRERYSDWFRSWEKRHDPPLVRVPASGSIELLAAVDFEVAKQRWEVRAAQVLTDAGDWFEWESLLSDS